MRPPALREHPRASWIELLLRRIRELAGRGEDVRESLEEMIEEADRHGLGGLSQEERALLLNVLAFGELKVDDVMVPRVDIAAVPLEAGLARVVETMRRSGHTRLLVYRDDLDRIEGFVHVRDLLAYWGDGAPFELSRLLRPVLVVPPAMPALDLLLEMRRTHQHVAVVVDEFGGTDGLVTLSDLVREIVGEMPDESEQAEQPTLVELEDGSLEADARLDVETLEQRLGTRLLEDEEREEVDTLGGLVAALSDRIPQVGDRIQHPAGVLFEIVEAEPRRIRKVRIRRLPPARPSASGAED